MNTIDEVDRSCDNSNATSEKMIDYRPIIIFVVLAVVYLIILIIYCKSLPGIYLLWGTLFWNIFFIIIIGFGILILCFYNLQIMAWIIDIFLFAFFILFVFATI